EAGQLLPHGRADSGRVHTTTGTGDHGRRPATGARDRERRGGHRRDAGVQQAGKLPGQGHVAQLVHARVPAEGLHLRVRPHVLPVRQGERHPGRVGGRHVIRGAGAGADDGATTGEAATGGGGVGVHVTT